LFDGARDLAEVIEDVARLHARLILPDRTGGGGGGARVTKTNALQVLVIVGFVRGLSVRDVEAGSQTRSAPRRR
jgi:hypothetical protein